MLDKMKQLMEFKKQADQIKRDLDTTTIGVEDVAGIKIEISGSQHVRSIEIDQNLLSHENKQNIEGDLLKSINAAIKKSQELAAQKMKNVMPGLPGI